MSDSRTDRADARDDEWWEGDWWDDDERGSDLTEITSLLIVGLGLASLFGLVPIEPFWLVFLIGFAVVYPIVAILEDRLTGDGETADIPPESEVRRRADWAAEADDSVADALDRLRDRYARGDLSDEQFEHKLEVLLETETPEDARERTGRRRRGRERESAETES